MDCFITQKLSWNLINKFPHSTFYWEGIDGSKILTHFPPADTYNAQANVKEAIFNVENFKDKERINESLYLFGNGDGGGGPTVDMIERIERLKLDIDGIPRFKYSTPREFFLSTQAKAKDLLTWVGELYLEFHRGTYTSQAQTKFYNRKNEILLRDVEILSIFAGLASSSSSSKIFADYPDLEEIWKLVLLNQFHDILVCSVFSSPILSLFLIFLAFS